MDGVPRANNPFSDHNPDSWVQITNDTLNPNLTEWFFKGFGIVPFYCQGRTCKSIESIWQVWDLAYFDVHSIQDEADSAYFARSNITRSARRANERNTVCCFSSNRWATWKSAGVFPVFNSVRHRVAILMRTQRKSRSSSLLSKKPITHTIWAKPFSIVVVTDTALPSYLSMEIWAGGRQLDGRMSSANAHRFFFHAGSPDSTGVQWLFPVWLVGGSASRFLSNKPCAWHISRLSRM